MSDFPYDTLRKVSFMGQTVYADVKSGGLHNVGPADARRYVQEHIMGTLGTTLLGGGASMSSQALSPDEATDLRRAFEDLDDARAKADRVLLLKVYNRDWS